MLLTTSHYFIQLSCPLFAKTCTVLLSFSISFSSLSFMVSLPFSSHFMVLLQHSTFLSPIREKLNQLPCSSPLHKEVAFLFPFSIMFYFTSMVLNKTFRKWYRNSMIVKSSCKMCNYSLIVSSLTCMLFEDQIVHHSSLYPQHLAPCFQPQSRHLANVFNMHNCPGISLLC